MKFNRCCRAWDLFIPDMATFLYKCRKCGKEYRAIQFLDENGVRDVMLVLTEKTSGRGAD